MVISEVALVDIASEDSTNKEGGNAMTEIGLKRPDTNECFWEV
jgi:hypothetical protein